MTRTTTAVTNVPVTTPAGPQPTASETRPHYTATAIPTSVRWDIIREHAAR